MERAEDYIKYTLVREKFELILGLVPNLEPNFIVLLFPVILTNSTHIILLNSSHTPSLENLLSFKSFYDKDLVYMLSINKTPGSFIQNLLQHYLIKELLIECQYEDKKMIEKLLKKLYQAEVKLQKSPMTQLYLKILLQYLLEMLDREEAFDNRDILLVREFYKMLNYDQIQNRQVKFYADKLCVSRRYLTWAVHKISGDTPKSFIDHNLVEKAKLLLHTKNSVYMIAEELQFQSHASFTTFFRKHTGLSPSVYRTNLNQKK
ncbi:helix-turn-helix domain-containing protein [Flavobacterium humidisoli]|uniref:Helix-turn-helix domain-containing protein n=1 Tax=Flavobacterium humidisoli TaxID=2937442 RepID=A0ABY4M1P9_9FLAO|nr:helix-turn-helix domain-containing protein [Flavobacterium humidisoli]UPZ17941.1 helix-turn-helix domain-containing protein [Flavobacterium humidisoli]